MAPVTFHLLILAPSTSPATFLSSLSSLPPTHRPIYVGHCEHWIHEPCTLSVEALLGRPNSTVTAWQYLLIHPALSPDSLALPSESISQHIEKKWSITAHVPDEALASYRTTNTSRLTRPAPALPPGWSSADHSSLDASIPPADVEFSFALHSHALGADRTRDQPIVLKDFVRSFGTSAKGTKPVQMLNLNSCLPGQMPSLMKYIEVFSSFVGKRYGGEPQVAGLEVTAWSSKESEGEFTTAEVEDRKQMVMMKEGEQKGPGWEIAALVWYPSLWHFGKLLDDPDYADADRRFKVGVLRDGPILMCTEIELEGSVH